MRKISRMIVLVLALTFAVVSHSSIQAQGRLGQVVPGRFIVVFNDDVSESTAVAQALSVRHGLIFDHIYRVALKGFSAEIPFERLQSVEADSRVKFIEPDRVVHVIKGPPPGKGGGGNGKDNPQPLQVIPTGIDRVDADLSSTASIDGFDERMDVDIAIIDTGVSKKHPNLNFYVGVTVSGVGKPGGDDDNGHGSHVAGIACAIDNNIGVVGVAPGCRLWSVKVLDKWGSGTLSGVIAGIDWATQYASQIEVANMSLGFEGTSNAFDTAIANSVATGIVYVVAAGNDTRDATNSSPANHPDVITVSAITDTDGQGGGLGSMSSYGGDDRNGDGVDDGQDDTFAWFSNFGSYVDLAAPGVDIYSTWKGNGYNTISGTSMASPHVAGAAALYLANNPISSPMEVREALIAAGTSQLDADGFTGDPDTYPEPLINGGSL